MVHPPRCEAGAAPSGVPEFREVQLLTGVGPNISPVMALVDFADGDSRADLILGSSLSYGNDVPAPLLMTVLTGDASGGLQNPVGPYEFDSAAPLTPIDFDDDGHTDFAGPGRQIARDAVRSEFADVVRPQTPPNAQHYWGDVNNDGRMDYVAVGASTVDVGLGDGDAGFQPTIRNLIAIPFLMEGTLVDVNADGNPDLVGIRFMRDSEVSTTGGSVVEVLRGDGAGRFVIDRAEDFQASIVRMRVGDFNCDSWKDLVLGYGDGRVVVRSGSAEGWLAGDSGVVLFDRPVNAAAQAVDALVADVNGDGAHDVVSVVRAQSESGAHDVRLAIHVGDGSGLFAEPAVLQPTVKPMLPFLLGAGDLDGDRRDEVIAIDPTIDLVVTLWDSQ